MELHLTRQDNDSAQVTVVCDNQSSHTFDIHTLIPNGTQEHGLSQPMDDPVIYGTSLYTALFPPGSAALQTLKEQPERIVLVTPDDVLDALPWEYAHGPDGFLVTQYPFVRGLLAERRISPPVLDQGLHIVAVPSNPISDRVVPLDIESEWTRLTSITRELPYAIALERTRPPTVERLRELVAGQQHRVVHFMGHGGQNEMGAILYFEQEDGELKDVTASELTQRLRGTTFLVTLNACKSATPGATHFSNLAAALVRMKIPYALGMRFSIHDDDALTFSKVFYGDLARGTSVEEALLQARLSLANSPRPWVIGVPVLYTSLNAPANGFTFKAGKPAINEHQPRTELFALSVIEGTFQGRIAELTTLGKALTGNSRPRLITIHGGGGQGKTALARTAAERFAFAWPDGVWAATLENLPTREMFVTDLARFLGVEVTAQTALDPSQLERQVISILSQRHLLLVLDNVETLIEVVDAREAAALKLADFLKRLPGRTVSLLVTSRRLLEWPGELSLELDGLSPREGAALFRQNAPQRAGECNLAQTEQFSEQLKGHPLGLLLLGKAFNAATLSLSSFSADYELHLLNAEDKYKDVDHRHRTLYASLETSLHYLNHDLRGLFSKLWLFHAPFMPAAAVTIFDPEHNEDTAKHSPVEDQLYALWQRGLLSREFDTGDDGVPLFYRLLPTIRPFVEHYLAQAGERKELLARFGSAYAQLVRRLYQELDRGGMVPLLVYLLREDLERGTLHVSDVTQGYYLMRLGRVLYRLGEWRRGMELTEQALEIAQGKEQQLELLAKNNLAAVYRDIGRPQEALRLYEAVLPIRKEVGDRAGEATTLNNIAGVYQNIGRPQEALLLYEAALPLTKEVGDRAGEVATLCGLAYLYRDLKRYLEAQSMFEQSILLSQQITYPAAEVAVLVGLAKLLYRFLNRSEEAIAKMEQAAHILQETELPQDAAGQTLDDVERFLEAMRAGIALEGQASSSATMPAEQIETIIANTVAVMTEMQERRAEWRSAMEQALQDAQQRGNDWQIEVDFYSAALAILDGQNPSLSDKHPYAEAVAAIQRGIATADTQGTDTIDTMIHAIRDFVNAEDWEATRHVVETRQELLYLPEVAHIFEQNIERAKDAGDERAVRLLEMHLAILRNCKEQGITQTFEQLQQAQDEQEDDTTFIETLIEHSILALRGGPQEKMAYMQQLTALSNEIEDEALKTLLTVIQMALFGGELTQLGGNLQDEYRQVWETIATGVREEEH